MRASGKTEDAIPLKFNFHGYYRTRYNWIGNAPMPVGSIPSASRFPSKNASYGYMRLRLDPEVTYGPNPDLPIARLRFTIDGLDNVAFGDNARVFGVPLFAVDQSYTDVYGNTGGDFGAQMTDPTGNNGNISQFSTTGHWSISADSDNPEAAATAGIGAYRMSRTVR